MLRYGNLGKQTGWFDTKTNEFLPTSAWSKIDDKSGASIVNKYTGEKVKLSQEAMLSSTKSKPLLKRAAAWAGTKGEPALTTAGMFLGGALAAPANVAAPVAAEAVGTGLGALGGTELARALRQYGGAEKPISSAKEAFTKVAKDVPESALEGALGVLPVAAIGKAYKPLGKLAEKTGEAYGKAARSLTRRALKIPSVPTKKAGGLAREAAREKGEAAVEAFLKGKFDLKPGGVTEAEIHDAISDIHGKVLGKIDELTSNVIAKRKAVPTKPITDARQIAETKLKTLRDVSKAQKSAQQAYTRTSKELESAMKVRPTTTSPKMWDNHIKTLTRLNNEAKAELESAKDAVMLANQEFKAANRAKLAEIAKHQQALDTHGIDTRETVKALDAIAADIKKLPKDKAAPLLKKLEQEKVELSSDKVISPRRAQEMKQRLHKMLQDAYTGKEPIDKIKEEAAMRFASRLGDQLEELYPELKDLNRESGNYLELLKHLTKTMDKYENSTGINLLDAGAAGAGALIHGSPGAAEAMVVNRMSKSPIFMAKLANVLEEAAGKKAGKAAKLAVKEINPKAAPVAKAAVGTALGGRSRRKWGMEEEESE